MCVSYNCYSVNGKIFCLENVETHQFNVRAIILKHLSQEIYHIYYLIIAITFTTDFYNF